MVAEGEVETPVRVKVSTGFTLSASVCDARQVDGLSNLVGQPFIRHTMPSCWDYKLVIASGTRHLKHMCHGRERMGHMVDKSR